MQDKVVLPDVGLSPLTRGNRAVPRSEHCRRGPIPAHAGQPQYITKDGGISGAYPRSRGATTMASQNIPGRQGLSPLTRGNPTASCTAGAATGPIPAHAGQPRTAATFVVVWRAYPRSRGATEQLAKLEPGDYGLSPLTRGNRLAAMGRSWSGGPIPAHAGQPYALRAGANSWGAYPRSRGATTRTSSDPGHTRGLSPLTRGNRARLQRWRCANGPIPAHAGQPCAQHARCREDRAYPRTRGATSTSHQKRLALVGLSPLTRGNRHPPHPDLGG